MKKTLYSAPVAELKPMDTQSIMQSSNIGIKGTPINSGNSGDFTPAAKGTGNGSQTTPSFDI